MSQSTKASNLKNDVAVNFIYRNIGFLSGSDNSQIELIKEKDFKEKALAVSRENQLMLLEIVYQFYDKPVALNPTREDKNLKIFSTILCQLESEIETNQIESPEWKKAFRDFHEQEGWSFSFGVKNRMKSLANQGVHYDRPPLPAMKFDALGNFLFLNPTSNISLQ